MSETLIYNPKTPVKKLAGYYVYNISDGMENWSQRKSTYVYTKNEYKSNWYSFCNVHMITMALDYLGYLTKYKSRFDKIYSEFPRFPDKLAKFMFENQEVLDFYKRVDPLDYKNFEAGKKDAVGPNEIHQVLSYATNLFVGYGNVTQFSTNVSWVDILDDIIYDSTPVGISGKFSGLHHIVLLVGAAYKKLDGDDRPGLLQQPDYLIIDDPYGKTYEYSKGLSGNDVWIPFQQCVLDFKSLNNPTHKFAHRFVRPQDLGL